MISDEMRRTLCFVYIVSFSSNMHFHDWVCSVGFQICVILCFMYVKIVIYIIILYYTCEFECTMCKCCVICIYVCCVLLCVMLSYVKYNIIIILHMSSFVVCCFYVLCIVLLLCVACVVCRVVCCCMLYISYFPSPLSGDGVPHELSTVSVSMGDKGDECHTANCVWCVSVSTPMCVRMYICLYVQYIL